MACCHSIQLLAELDNSNNVRADAKNEILRAAARHWGQGNIYLQLDDQTIFEYNFDATTSNNEPIIYTTEVLPITIPDVPHNRSFFKHLIDANYQFCNNVVGNSSDSVNTFKIKVVTGQVVEPYNRLRFLGFDECGRIQVELYNDTDIFERAKNCKICNLELGNFTVVAQDNNTVYAYGVNDAVYVDGNTPIRQALIDINRWYDASDSNVTILPEDYTPLLSEYYLLNEGICKCLGYRFISRYGEFHRRVWLPLLRDNYWAYAQSETPQRDEVIYFTPFRDYGTGTNDTLSIATANNPNTDLIIYGNINNTAPTVAPQLNIFKNSNTFPICMKACIKGTATFDIYSVGNIIVNPPVGTDYTLYLDIVLTDVTNITNPSGAVELQRKKVAVLIQLPVFGTMLTVDVDFEVCFETVLNAGRQIVVGYNFGDYASLSPVSINAAFYRVAFTNTYTKFTTCLPYLSLGETYPMSRFVNCEYTLYDIILGAAHRLGAMIVVDDYEQTLTFMPMYDTTHLNEFMQGYVRPMYYAINHLGHLECCSHKVTKQSVTTCKEYTLGYNSSTDNFVSTIKTQLNSDVQPLDANYTLLNGSDCKSDNRNPFYEGTLERKQSKLKVSGFGEIWLPAIHDSDTNRTRKFSPRVFLAYGIDEPIRQLYSSGQEARYRRESTTAGIHEIANALIYFTDYPTLRVYGITTVNKYDGNLAYGNGLLLDENGNTRSVNVMQSLSHFWLRRIAIYNEFLHTFNIWLNHNDLRDMQRYLQGRLWRIVQNNTVGYFEIRSISGVTDCDTSLATVTTYPYVDGGICCVGEKCKTMITDYSVNVVGIYTYSVTYGEIMSAIINGNETITSPILVVAYLADNTTVYNPTLMQNTPYNTSFINALNSLGIEGLSFYPMYDLQAAAVENPINGRSLKVIYNECMKFSITLKHSATVYTRITNDGFAYSVDSGVTWIPNHPYIGVSGAATPC